jgi:hypothetical protein
MTTKKLESYKSLVAFCNDNKCFEINNNELFCNLCNCKREYTPSEGVAPLRRHLNSKSHLIAMERKRHSKDEH